MADRTNVNDDGLLIPQQDLSAESPGAGDHGRLYNHDASSSITLVNGSTTTDKGFYMWDNSAGAWNPLKNTFSVAENLETQGSTATVRDTTNSIDIARFAEGGGVSFPNGTLTIKGSEVFHSGHKPTLSEVVNADPSKIITGTLANQPTAGTAGRWYLTTDNNGIYYDDGTAWNLIAEHPSNISSSELGFDPATQSELNSHEGTTTAHGDAVPISMTHAEWGSGLSNEEIWRLKCPSGKSLEVHALDVQFNGGGSSTSFDVEVYDATAATSLVTDTAGGGPTTGSPAATSGSGNVVILRLTNSTGNKQTASLAGSFYLV